MRRGALVIKKLIMVLALLAALPVSPVVLGLIYLILKH